MRRVEVERFLRQFEPLKEVELNYESAYKEAIAPQVMTLSGCIHIYGEPLYYETEINLNDFKTGDDLIQLVKSLLLSFQKAETERPPVQ